jgi:thymidylate synthase ThyX
MEIPVHPQHLEILLPQTLFTEFSLRINIIEFQQFLLTYRNSPSQELHQYLQAMNDLVVEAAPWTSDILKGN